MPEPGAAAAELCFLATREFVASRGRYFRVRSLSGYRGDHQHDVNCATLNTMVRVDPTTAEDILHRTGEWLDPYWNVTVVEGMPDPPLEACWIFGTSYNLTTGASQPGDILSPVRFPLKHWLRLHLRTGRT